VIKATDVMTDLMRRTNLMAEQATSLRHYLSITCLPNLIIKSNFGSFAGGLKRILACVGLTPGPF